MPTATITLSLIYDDPERLRVASILNWSGKALAAPRTEFDELLRRPECAELGVYILTGPDPDTGKPMAYIGEAEVLRDRMKSHRDKAFWDHAVVFLSNDESLTKSHTRYLEGRLIDEARQIDRFILDNAQASGSKLPESGRAYMEAFLEKIRWLLPILGSELLTPIVKREPIRTPIVKREPIRTPIVKREPSVTLTGELTCRIKGLVATGKRTSTGGFVVYAGSQAVLSNRPSAPQDVLKNREKLIANDTLVQDEDHYRFTRNTEFSSPSAAACVVRGGAADGLIDWKDKSGRSLKELEME